MFRNFLLTALIFFVSVAIFYITLHRLNPLGEQKNIAYIAFFISLFCGISAFFTFFFFFGAELFSKRKLGTTQFLTAVRRGILVSIFITSLALLQLLRLINLMQYSDFRAGGLLEITLLVIFLSLVEYIFISASKT